VEISIAAAGVDFDSAALSLLERYRLVGWEFTTPNYTNPVTTTVSLVSASGRTLVTGAAVNEATPSAKICDVQEKAPVLSGCKVHALLSGVAGDIATLTVLLYVEDAKEEVNVYPLWFTTLNTFQLMPDALLVQAAPVQNTWYTVLDTVANCRLIGLGIGIATVGEDLEVKITVDGRTIIGTGTAVEGAEYQAMIHTHDTGTVLVFSSTEAPRSFIIEGRSIKVEIRKTTANGAGNLLGCAMYGQRG
jgi:hypothetical protein